MRAFVLCTGRCGSTTFARACDHITNFSSGHETNIAAIDDRLRYPDQHIEVDSRLAWFLGELGATYPEAVVYVHLLRDDDAVVRSYMKRVPDVWSRRGRVVDSWRRATGRRRLTIGDAFSHGIIMRQRLNVGELERALHVMVQTINSNIVEFLRNRPHITITIADPEAPFRRFWSLIDARGDLTQAIDEFTVRYNASRPPAGGAAAVSERSEPSDERLMDHT